ncbi:MAG: carboxypeptidase-like regulatory domain-containing protein, partial [Thermoanaerobaculia bacterium]
MKVLRLFAICAMAAVVSAPLFGQGASATYGNIYGKVSDESGGALPGVSVTLTGGGGARTATSGGQGEFRFLNLAPGSYTVKTELNG